MFEELKKAQARTSDLQLALKAITEALENASAQLQQAEALRRIGEPAVLGDVDELQVRVDVLKKRHLAAVRALQSSNEAHDKLAALSDVNPNEINLRAQKIAEQELAEARKALAETLAKAAANEAIRAGISAGTIDYRKVAQLAFRDNHESFVAIRTSEYSRLRDVARNELLERLHAERKKAVAV